MLAALVDEHTARGEAVAADNKGLQQVEGSQSEGSTVIAEENRHGQEICQRS